MKCCIESCVNNGKVKKIHQSSASTTEKITYHLFPKDQKQRETWLKSLGIPNLIPTNRTWICSDHFKEEDVYFTQNEIRRIKQGVVPFIEGSCYGFAALRTCKICLTLDVKMYKIQDHGLDKMYEDIIGIPPRIDAQNRLPMSICWECTARLQSASAFRSKALFSDALLEDHLKNNADLNIIDIQNIHEQQTNLNSSIAIQEVFRFNSHNAEEHAPNTFIKTEVLGIPNNEEIEIDLQRLVTENNTVKDELKNELVIENFVDTDLKTEVDLIPDNDMKIGEEDTRFDDEFSDNDNSEADIENVNVNESRKDFEKVLRADQEIKKVDFAANLTEIMQTDDDELLNLAKNLTSEDEDYDDKSNASDDGGIQINLTNKTVRCVKIKPEEMKKKKLDDGLVVWVKGRPKKKQPFVKCVPIDENVFSTRMLSHDDLMREVRERRDSDKYQKARYKCNVCFRGFPTQDKKKRHVIKHSEKNGPIKCNICHIRMKRTRDLRAHMKKHTMEFVCKLCPMVTRIRTVALGHIKYHAGNKYVCPQCNVQFEKNTTLLNHLRLKHMSAYVCELCGYTFVSETGVRTHKRMKHKFLDANTEFKGPHCDVCDVKFLTEKAYKRHLRLSSKHITEDDPNRMSNDPSIKQRQLGKSNWHSVRRPVIHRKSETTPATNGPVTCEQCGVVLESLRVYSTHFRYAHPGINRTQFTYTASPYMCEHCGKLFLNTTTLSCHMWVHTGQKLFQCDYCNKTFSMKANLAGHIKKHEGSQSTFDCRVCGKQFTLSYNLTRHMFLHAGIKPFKCDACDKKFRTISEMRSHVDHVHLKKPRPKRVRRRANKCELPTLEY